MLRQCMKSTFSCTFSSIPIRYSMFLLLLINFEQAFARQQTHTDSLKHQLTQSIPDTIRVNILDELAATLPEGEWEGYNDQMETFVTEKLKSAQGKEKRVYLSALAAAYNNKSLTYKYTGQISKALEYGEKSLSIFKDINDQPNISIGSFNNGKLYWAMGDINKAISSIQLSLKLAEKIDRKDMQTYCLNYLGFINKEQHELDKSLEYHQAAYKIAVLTGDKETLNYTITCLGLVFKDQHRYTEALDAFEKALALSKEVNHLQNIATQYHHIGAIYETQKKYRQARVHFKRSLAINEKRDDQIGMSAAHSAIGKNYFHTGDVGNAETHLSKGLSLAQHVGFPGYISIAAEGLYEVYKQTGKAKKALQMHELFVQMRDSVNNEVTRKNIIRSQYKYEFEKKSAADSIHRVEEKKINAEQLARVRNQRYALVVSMLLILTLAGFVFYRIRSKQRINELKLRNRIASDLHDDIGSALSSISLFAGIARMNGDQSNGTLAEKIENASRETIENMNDIVWSIQTKSDSLANVLSKMKYFSEGIMSSAAINFTFQYEAGLEKLYLDMVSRKNLYLIFKEAVNNIIKYSKANHASAELKREGKYLVILIKDDGIGFNSSASYSGNGLINMKHRAEEIKGTLLLKSASGEGTVLDLKFPL